MEVLNREDIRPFMKQIPESVRAFGPGLLMYLSLKFIIFLVLNLIIMICVFPCVWDSLNKNKIRKMEEDRKYILQSSQAINEE